MWDWSILGVSTYSPATWKKYKLQSQWPKCLPYQSRVTTTALEVKTVQHHWIPSKVMILNWWDLQQLSATRHFFQAQTVIYFPGPRFHGGTPSIHRIPGFPLDLCFFVQDFLSKCFIQYSDQWQSKENNLFIKWSQDAFVPERISLFSCSTKATAVLWGSKQLSARSLDTFRREHVQIQSACPECWDSYKFFQELTLAKFYVISTNRIETKYSRSSS